MKKKQSFNLNDINVDEMWDITTKKYLKLLNNCRDLVMREEFKDDSIEDILKRMGTFIEKCKEPEFQIAFVGAIKAGKSTLINAVIGNNLASTAVTPETATLTKFKNSKKYNYIKIEFYTNDEWNKLISSVKDSNEHVFSDQYSKLKAEDVKKEWVNHSPINKTFDDVNELKVELEKWTSSKQKDHFFVKSVEVGLKNLKMPRGVVIVDTPGLDDPVKYRSDITREYIDKANAVIVCVKSDSLTGAELSTIYRVFANSKHNLNKIFVVGTQMDTLNRPMKNWEEQKETWIELLKKEPCYGNEELARKNIVGVAAYIDCLIRDIEDYENEDDLSQFQIIKLKYNVKDDDTEKVYKILTEYSNISYLKNTINENVLKKYKKIQLEDLTEGFENINNDIVLKFSDIIKNEEDIIKSKSKSREELEQDIEKLKLEYKTEEEKNKKLKDELKEVESALNDELCKLFDDIRNMVIN